MKRNFKLITTFASIFIVLCVMAIGVWAATTQSLSISTRVSFTATNFQGTIYGTLSGLGSAEQYYSALEPYVIQSDVHTLLPWEQSATRAILDTDSNGIPDTIIYEIFITSGIDASASVNLSAITYSAAFSIQLASKIGENDYITKVILGQTPTATCDLGQIEPSGDFQFKVIFTVLDAHEDITSATLSFDTSIERI